MRQAALAVELPILKAQKSMLVQVAGISCREQDAVKNLCRIHRAFVPSENLGRAMAAILTLFMGPVALHVIIAHPGAVKSNHLFPARCSCEFGVGHTSDDIEVRFDKILPCLPLVYALFLDPQCRVHVHCLVTGKNRSTITYDGFGGTCGRERGKEHFVG